jgi:hypothetical protein
MGKFQAFVVRGTTGPVVTMHAGVDFAGYFWTTTSRSAAKVKALRRDSTAAVLSRKHESWTLRAGRTVVIDPAHPSDAIRELPVFALAGTALALIAARYPEQLLGYAADGGSTPKAWRLRKRVLIAMRHDDEITWRDDGTITHQSARFRPDSSPNDHLGRVPATATASPPELNRAPQLEVDGSCWLGLDSEAGPLVLPAQWDASRSTVRVTSAILAATHPWLPGRACVTIDSSDSARPSDKAGIIARGEATLGRRRSGSSSILVDVDAISTWSGFRARPVAA